MVTKVYCDHCGHAAPNAQKYIFGAHNYFFGINDPGHQTTTGISQSQQGGLAGCLAQQAKGLPAYRPSVEIVRSGSVDLCDTCQIVWMNRVKALTQASEP